MAHFINGRTIKFIFLLTFVENNTTETNKTCQFFFEFCTQQKQKSLQQTLSCLKVSESPTENLLLVQILSTISHPSRMQCSFLLVYI
jgi:hypothetical protein